VFDEAALNVLKSQLGAALAPARIGAQGGQIPTHYLPNDASCTIRGNGFLIAPKVFEPVRCQLSVTHRVLDVLVAEPSL
jgi:hypothetical protein